MIAKWCNTDLVGIHTIKILLQMDRLMLDFCLVVAKEGHKLLDVQIVGEKGVDKWIDGVAAALFNKMTLEQLIDLDLEYAPPFNDVSDAMQQIAMCNGNF